MREGGRKRERERERKTCIIQLTMHSTLRAFSGPKKPIMILMSLLLILLRAVSGESEKVDGRASSTFWPQRGS